MSSRNGFLDRLLRAVRSRTDRHGGGLAAQPPVGHVATPAEPEPPGPPAAASVQSEPDARPVGPVGAAPAGSGTDPAPTPVVGEPARDRVPPRLPADQLPLDRPIMRDPVAERELSRRGYTVIHLLDDDEVAELRDYYVSSAAAGDLNPPGAYDDRWAEFTIVNSRPDFRRAAFDRISGVLGPRLDQHLVDCRPVIANFVNKPPGTGLVPLHQNITVVDEGRHRSVSVWVALVDCGPGNGALEFIDHSHLAFRGRRGQWAYSDYEPVEGAAAGLLRRVDVPAGHAIVLDDAVIHYSPPNESDDRRLAIQYVVAPAEAPTVYWEKVAQHGHDLELDEMSVGPDYFFDFWLGAGDRDRGRLTRRVVQSTPPLDEDEFLQLVGRGRALAESLGP